MRIVSPSARERALFANAVSFLPRLGRAIPPATYRVQWFGDDWGENLNYGWTDVTGRIPVAVRLKAGRLRPGCPDEAMAETGLLSTIFHELGGHVFHVLTWPFPPMEDKVRDEDEAEAFAERAIAALADHHRKVQQLLAEHAVRMLR